MSVYRPTRAGAIAGLIALTAIGASAQLASAADPQELSQVCVAQRDGALRHTTTAACKKGETLRTIRANDPLDVCASGDRVLLATSCAGTALTLPPSSDPVNFCARSGSFLRYVTASTDCGRRELAFVVSPPEPPVIALTGSALATYTEGDDATAVDPNLTVADPDSTNLSGAVARVSDGFQVGDVLAVPNPSGLSHSYDPTTGVLTLSGTATVATYQSALRSLTFAHTGDTPSTSRTIGLTATDVGGTTSTETTHIFSVAPTLDAFTVTTTASNLSYTEGAGPVVVDPGVVLDNPDNNSIASVEVQPITGYDPGQDVLSYSGDLISFWDSDFNTLVLLGAPETTLAEYQAALRSVTYTNTSDAPTPARTMAFWVFYVGGYAVATRNVVITPVGDPPTAVNDAASTSFPNTVTIDVLANDTDPDGGPKTITSASDPPRGTVTLTGGSPGAHTGLQYKNDVWSCGSGSPRTDSFTYTLNGGSTATVSITLVCPIVGGGGR